MAPSRWMRAARRLGADERRAQPSREARALWQVAAERGLHRPLHNPDVSSTAPGRDGNANLLVSERGHGPVVMVRINADQRQLDEYQLLAALRRCVEQDEVVLAAFPEPPLYSGVVDGTQVVVERFDPAETQAGTGEPAKHLDLLARLQARTRRPQRPWTADDALAVLSRSAERLTRLPTDDAGAALLECVRVELDRAIGAPLAMVAVHGDFRRGTLAQSGAGLRLLGWRWSAATGHPAFDRWTYELDELRVAALAGAVDLDDRVASSLAAVARDCDRYGIDVRFARAMLLPVALELATRTPDARPRAERLEPVVTTLLSSVERVLSSPHRAGAAVGLGTG